MAAGAGAGAGAGNRELKKFKVRVRVSDEYIEFLKAKPPREQRRRSLSSEEEMSWLPPEERARHLANDAKKVALTNKWLDENIRIFDEYTRNGVAYEVVDVTESELEKIRSKGVPYEFVDEGAEHGIQA